MKCVGEKSATLPTLSVLGEIYGPSFNLKYHSNIRKEMHQKKERFSACLETRLFQKKSFDAMILVLAESA